MTNDRIVAALKPAVLDELPQGDMDARIAAIVSSPRPARATRTRRASLRPLPLAMTGIMAVLAAGGAVVVAAGVSGSAHRSAHRVTSVPPAPPRVQAAALSFTRHGGYLTVQVKDPVADPMTPAATTTAPPAARTAMIPVMASGSGRREARRVRVARAGRGLETIAAILASMSPRGSSSRTAGLRAATIRSFVMNDFLPAGPCGPVPPVPTAVGLGRAVGGHGGCG